MSSEELKLDSISIMCMRCTVDTKSDCEDIYSSEFYFKGGGWKLNYIKSGIYYGLALSKCSGVPPPPLNISVCLESSVNGQFASFLSQEKSFTTEFKENDPGQYIWKKGEGEILGCVPEFLLHGVLKLLVVLMAEGDSDSTASQSVAEATELRSTSVQTTLFMSGTPCLESLSKDLDRLRVDDSHHDVEFHCEGRTTKAHRSIVCQRSPVIASMLSTDMVEGRTGIVSIPDMAPDIFAQFMRYIYCGQLDELTFDIALRLYKAGYQYEVLGLAKRCSEFLLS